MSFQIALIDQLSSSAILNRTFIDEISEHICLNDGPDEKLRAHPTRKPNYKEFKTALDKAKAKGFAINFEPFHFHEIRGIYNDQNNLDQILYRKITQLINSEFEGNIGKFITQVKARQLLSPLIEIINGKEYRTAINGSVFKAFDTNLYSMITHYLKITKNFNILKNLKPYHLSSTPRGVASSIEIVEELMQRKIEELLKNKYNNNLVLMAKETSSQELSSPLIDKIAKIKVSVSMNMAFEKHFGGSPEKAILWYAKKTGRENEITGLSTHHFRKASSGTFHIAGVADELILKKFKQLIEKKGGNLGKLINEISYHEISSAICENIAGTNVEVSMGASLIRFKGNVSEIIQYYLRLTNQTEEWKKLRPYHYNNASNGTYRNQEIINELLVKVIDQILINQCDGQYDRLPQKLSTKVLESPFYELINGYNFKVSTGNLCNKFGNSPFIMLKEYYKLKNQVGLANALRPFHMARTSSSKKLSKESRDQLLLRKCNEICREIYSGDLDKFCANVTITQLQTPLLVKFQSQTISVSMHGVSGNFNDSPTLIVKRYLYLIDEKDKGQKFKAFHRMKKPKNFLKNSRSKRELYKVQLDSILKDNFNGDITRLVSEVNLDILKKPLIINGTTVSMTGSIVNANLYQIIKNYLSDIGENELSKKIKPYHLLHGIRKPSKNNKFICELLEKRIDNLLNTKYKNDFGRFCNQTTQAELLSIFHEKINNHKLIINSQLLAGAFNSSPFAMIQKYLEIKGNTKLLAKIRPYHLGKTSQGFTNDEEMIKELVLKKVALLLNKKYKKNFEEFLANFSYEELKTPFIDRIAGVNLIANSSPLLYYFNHSRFKVVESYCKIIKKPFNYSPACMIGTIQTRRRRIIGTFSYTDLRIPSKISGIPDTRHFGFPQFKTQDKQKIRELLAQEVQSFLLDQPVNYLGLETEQFDSYRLFLNHLEINPKESVIVEMDERRYNAMKAIQTNSDRQTRSLLSGLRLVNKLIQTFIQEDCEDQFNFINFDYLGHFSKNKEYSLQLLFEKNLLKDQAVISITLDNSALAIYRTEHAGYSANQYNSVLEVITRVASLKGYKIIKSTSLPYFGGTSENSKYDMLFMCFSVERLSDNS